LEPLRKIFFEYRTLLAKMTLDSVDNTKYIKLAKVMIVHVLGSMEDEQCFSSLSFLKISFKMP